MNLVLVEDIINTNYIRIIFKKAWYRKIKTGHSNKRINVFIKSETEISTQE